MASLLTKLKPNRRWMQLSLRTGFILVTLLCVALSIWVVPAERQLRAVMAFVAANGKVTLAVPDGFLRRWLPADHFYPVQEISLWASDIRDIDLVHLQVVTAVERLYLHDTLITDAGLVHLQRLSNLKELSLGETQITDTGLLRLHELKALRELHLGGTQVTRYR